MQKVIITVLVENTVKTSGLMAEHGLSFWIQYGDKNILFDTGQSELLISNAELLDIDLSSADFVVLSHGHYDHTGGLRGVLKKAENAIVYLHPSSLEPKYHKRDDCVKEIGIESKTRELLYGRVKTEKAFYTRGYNELLPGLGITGQIPRSNVFEDTGGSFFLDTDCSKPDPLIDDQAMFIDSEDGLVVIFGCAHSGIINTLEHIEYLTKEKKIKALVGGMHLLHADKNRMENTIEAIYRYKPDLLYPCHCTGVNAERMLWQHFGDICRTCSVGTVIEI